MGDSEDETELPLNRRFLLKGKNGTQENAVIPSEAKNPSYIIIPAMKTKERFLASLGMTTKKCHLIYSLLGWGLAEREDNTIGNLRNLGRP